MIDDFIGPLYHPRAVYAFADYLTSIGIDNSIVPQQGAFYLQLSNPAQRLQAETELTAFLAAPQDQKYFASSWEHGQTDNALQYKNSGLGLIEQFWQHAGGFGITSAIFIACVLLFLAMQLGYERPIYFHLGFFEVTQSATWEQFWRLFTPSLLHADLLHLSFNLLWWWYLGGQVERRLGHTHLALLLLLAGTAPNLLQYYLSGPYFLGLSGVTYALIGFVWLYGLQHPQAGLSLPNAYMTMALLWLVLGLTDLLGLNMANGAHIGGLAIGLVYALLCLQGRKRK